MAFINLLLMHLLCILQGQPRSIVLILLPSLSIGLPLDVIVTAMCDHDTRNHTITVVLQSDSERITTVFGSHRLSTEHPKSEISVSLKHNISKIKEHGIPFIVEATGYYEVSSACDFLIPGRTISNSVTYSCALYSKSIYFFDMY